MPTVASKAVPTAAEATVAYSPHYPLPPLILCADFPFTF